MNLEEMEQMALATDWQGLPKAITKEDLTYILSIVSHFYMDSSSVTQRKKAMTIMQKLQREINHD
jgi:hypothetical protein